MKRSRLAIPAALLGAVACIPTPPAAPMATLPPPVASDPPPAPWAPPAPAPPPTVAPPSSPPATTSTTIPSPPGGGYTPNLWATTGTFAVRIHPSAAVMADDVAWVLDQAELHSDVEFVIGPPATSTTAEAFEIVIAEGYLCGSANEAGCASTSYDSTLHLALKAKVTVAPTYVNDPHIRRLILLHEIGHVLGLGHFDEQYEGSNQIMKSWVSPELSNYRSGDVNGLMAKSLEATATLAPYLPFGALDPISVNAAAGTATLSGWAVDRDALGPINVTITVDGVVVKTVSANGYRPLPAEHASLGNFHGFSTTVNVPAGTSSVCAVAVNVSWWGFGRDTTLGCESVTSNAANTEVRVASVAGPPPVVPTTPSPLVEDRHPFFLEGDDGG